LSQEWFWDGLGMVLLLKFSLILSFPESHSLIFFKEPNFSEVGVRRDGMGPSTCGFFKQP
jgi:hypothetical protein